MLPPLLWTSVCYFLVVLFFYVYLLFFPLSLFPSIQLIIYPLPSDSKYVSFPYLLLSPFTLSTDPDVKVEYHTTKIQEFPASWYSKFNVVIAGLDNVEARVWLNKTLNDLVKYDEDGDVDFDSVIPLIDGGTEGFRGQARVFFPKLTSCFHCSLDSIPQQNHFHSCTIANTPRIPEHCIQYVKEVMWPNLMDFQTVDEYKMYKPSNENDENPSPVSLDADNAEHMSWIFNRSVERAAEFGISGVTFKLTMQVVKNIIPAVASTNAIVSAACVNEAVKIVSRSQQLLNNFMQYNGVSMYGCMLHEYAKKPDCPVCCLPTVFEIAKATSLSEVIARLESELEMEGPSIIVQSSGDVLFRTVDADSWKENLSRHMGDLVKDKAALAVSAKFKKNGVIIISFTDE